MWKQKNKNKKQSWRRYEKMIDYKLMERMRQNVADSKFLTRCNQLVDVLTKDGRKVLQPLVLDFTFLTRFVKFASFREDASEQQEMCSGSARWKSKGRRRRLYGAARSAAWVWACTFCMTHLASCHFCSILAMVADNGWNDICSWEYWQLSYTH